MIYVLIVVSGVLGGPYRVTFQEFNSKATCEAAATETHGKAGGDKIQAYCMPK